MNKVKVSPFYKAINSSIWVALHVAGHMQFTVTSSARCHALYYNRFETTWRSAYCHDEYKANSFIATSWKRVEDVGYLTWLLNQHYTVYINFDHQRLNMQTATSFSLQIISSSSVARLASPKKPLSKSNKHILSWYVLLKNSFSINSTRN